ncbi:MAG TPA: hypothetical protein VHZ95_03670 [Polyangiales bacterium]|nr:hypothetical protein [Polyangiales bacterium]
MDQTRSIRDRAIAFTIACALWTIALGGCSAIVDADKSKLGALPVPCNVGKTASCPCPDGTKSTQLCNNLARYDACACQGHSQAGRAAAGAAGTAIAGRSGAGGAAGHATAGAAGAH